MQNVKADDQCKLGSIWLRPLRYLFENGSELPDVRLLAAGASEKDQLPFGAIARTENDRIVFWPAFPSKCDIYDDEGEPSLQDHVTLELSNGKVHATGFTSDGQRRHQRSGLR